MKIIKLEAENYKKLKAIEITPSGNIVELTGKNEAGKTSILDAISTALGATIGNRKLISDGKSKAKIKLDFGDFTLSKTITNKGATLKIESDGYEKKSPQKFLDNLLGSISFDPMQFINSKPKEQRQILLDFTDLDIDKFDSDRKKIYDDRTVLRRQYKETENVFQSKVFTKEMPEDEILVSDLMLKLEDVRKYNLEISEKEKDIGIHEKDIANMDSEIEDLKLQLDTLNSNRKERVKIITSLKSSLEKMEIKDEEIILTEINELDNKNILIRGNKEYLELKSNLSKMKKEGEKQIKDIDNIDLAKEKAIQESNMPLDNLSFSDTGVLINNIPLEELSQAVKIRTGLAVSMALNPKIKVLRITDGSLLDSNSMKIIAEMAEKNDFQIWIEKVDESGKVGFYIEDGSVVNEKY